MYSFDTLHKNPTKLHSEPDYMVCNVADSLEFVDDGDRHQVSHIPAFVIKWSCRLTGLILGD